MLPYRWPCGLDRIVESIKADRASEFPELMIRRYAEMKNRTYEYYIAGSKGYLTADPKNLQAILATQFHDFGLGPMRSGNIFPLLGKGIFTVDGKSWEHSRAMLRPQFVREQVSDLELEEEHVQNLMKALPVDSNGRTAEVDLSVLFFRLTLDSACEILFGESVGSQIAALPGYTHIPKAGRMCDGIAFGAAFDKAQAYLATRSRLLEAYWVYDPPAFRRCCKEVHDFIDYFVELALNASLKERALEKGSISRKGKYVFLEALVAETRDPLELRSQLLNILLAGRDTTASLLGWVFYFLARKPEIHARLRAAVLDEFGSYSNPREITFSRLRNCQYLQHVLNEALRVCPAVSVNTRRCMRDTTLPRGGGPDGLSKIYVKKGMQIDYSVHAMHHLKELWGEDADEFKPDRWQGRKPGWEYLPFNGGPRICLGRKDSLVL